MAELSCGDLVLAGEATEDLSSADPALGQVDLRRLGTRLSGCELAEGAVRPGCVVVLQVFGQYLAQVVLIDDQQPINELTAQGGSGVSISRHASPDSPSGSRSALTVTG